MKNKKTDDSVVTKQSISQNTNSASSDGRNEKKPLELDLSVFSKKERPVAIFGILMFVKDLLEGKIPGYILVARPEYMIIDRYDEKKKSKNKKQKTYCEGSHELFKDCVMSKEQYDEIIKHLRSMSHS